MPAILLVDDDPGLRASLTEVLRELGAEVRSAEGVEEARLRLQEGRPDAVLADLMLPDGSGLDLLDDVDIARTRFVVVTGHADVDTAVRSLRAGVHDFLAKPVDLERLRRLVRGLDGDQDPEDDTPPPAGAVVGNSPAMRQVFDAVGRVAPTDATVLLVGESGTGKELIARAIHDASERSDGPYLAVNCGAMPGELVASELFGHERGSFTGANRQHKGVFERANGGTLFLDEITEMPEDLQTHLLRVLETSVFRRVGGSTDIACNVRIVAATNRAPEQAIEEGDLREDLYFRLAVFPIRLPRLHEREGDVLLLAEHVLAHLNTEAPDDRQRRFAQGAMQVLEHHDWPGNVRELYNVVQRAFILCDEEITARDLERAIGAGIGFLGGTARLGVGASIRDMERQLITETLHHYDGDKRTAAKVLGISLKTLYNRLKEYESS